MYADIKLVATEKKEEKLSVVYVKINFKIRRSLDLVQPSGIPLHFVWISKFCSLNGKGSCPFVVNGGPIFWHVVMTKIEGNKMMCQLVSTILPSYSIEI